LVLGLSDARHFRRLAAGFCLIAAPLVLFVGAVVHPQSKEDSAAHLAVVGDNPDRYYAAHALLLIGLALFLPAILGLMHLLRVDATAFGHVGGGLTMIGLLGATAVVAVDGVAVTQMGQPEASPQEMAALLDRIKESAGFRAIAVIGAVSFLLGALLLAYGLWRARAVQPWVAAGIAVGAIAVFIGQVTDNRTIFAIAFAIYLVALGPLGWRLLTESDEEWAREPQPSTPIARSGPA
jgi:Domain of unknown function (DUF4386)